jgi:DNA-binding response OmpR family regulator
MPARILVVDDSATIRKVVSAVLQRRGFESLQAVDGQAALDVLTEAARSPDDATRIDLALVDYVMPRMNGFQLCRAIRQDDALRTIPVVLMSARSDRIQERSVHQTGAIDAITKPFDAQALVAVIENALRRAERWRARGEAIAAGIPDTFDAPDALTLAGRKPGPRVALSGDMAVIPIGAALQLLQIEAQSGVLVVSDGTTEVTVSMRRGRIDLVQARGAGDEFRLGRYFIEHGLVTPDDIDHILRDSSPPRLASEAPDGTSAEGGVVKRGDTSAEGGVVKPGDTSAEGGVVKREDTPAEGGAPRKLLGELLVDAGRVTREQLRDALARQSSELVYEVLRWPLGHFEFRPEPLPALAQSAQLGLPVASVVMEGFRRVDEWRVVEAGLGSFEAVLLADQMAVDAGGIERLPKPEQRLLEMIDGERTVREIVDASHMSSFDACRILFQLLEARLVRRRAA